MLLCFVERKCGLMRESIEKTKKEAKVFIMLHAREGSTTVIETSTSTYRRPIKEAT